MARTKITPKMLRAAGVATKEANAYAAMWDEALLVPNDGFNSITSLNGVAMLVATVAHESGGLTAMSESLNYTVEALMEDSRFTNDEAARFGAIKTKNGQGYIRRADEVMVGEIKYGGRYGNSKPGDGYKYRGGGWGQLTFYDNYRAWGDTLGLTPEQAVEYVRTPQGSVSSVMWFWRLPEKGLVVPASRGDVTRVTRIYNGGANGLQARIKLFNKVKAAAA